MSFIYTLLIISVIVVVHEFGHLLLAKKNGIEVVEFSVGFGPTLFAFEHGGTKYSLKLILFGGACQMTGENFLEEEATGEIPENSMMAKSPWARFSVIAAGPIFNFLLAFVLAIVLLAVGHVDLPIVHQVVKGSSAEQVGLQPGDKLLTINGEKIVIGRDVDLYLLTDPLMGEPVEITWERDGVKYSGTLDTKMERYMIGISYYVEQDAILSVVSEGYPAYEAGLRAGDLIVRIDDMEIADGRGIEAYFNANEIGENSIEIEYVRNGEHFVTQMTPKLYKYHDLGFMASGYRYEVSPLQVLRYAFTEVRYWIENTISSLAMMIRGQVGLDAVSGPVGVVSMVGDVVEESKPDGVKYVFLNLLNLTILLSANLGVINLLPIPAMDGGRLVFILIEGITGKPVSRKVEGIIHAVGIILLFILMIVVLFKDLFALF